MSNFNQTYTRVLSYIRRINITQPNRILVATRGSYLQHSLSPCYNSNSTSQVSFIHQTTPSLARRRRRNQNIDLTQEKNEDAAAAASPLVPTAVRDPDLFFIEAESFLDKVETALAPMKLCNDVFEIERSDGIEIESLDAETYLYIRLKPGDGTYTLRVDDVAMTLSLSSPISGGHTYVLCANTREWVGEEDGHSLEGILVRDLIRQCNGVPKF